MKSTFAEAQQRRLDTASFAPVRISGAPFEYRKPLLQINGPPLSDIENLAQMGYLQHIQPPCGSSCYAAGFTPEIACMRALFDAHVDLFMC